MEISEVLRFVSALVFVVGLIAACAWAARRFGLMPSQTRGSTSGRLAIVESLAIDAKRKLVIIRHDDKEHVLMLGETDLVIQAGLDAKRTANITPISENVPTAFQMNAASKAASPLPGAPATIGQQIERVVSFLKERRA